MSLSRWSPARCCLTTRSSTSSRKERCNDLSGPRRMGAHARTRRECPTKLLCAAHYKHSPLDLRRMMDAPGQHVAVAQTDPVIAGALWLVDEGRLNPALSRAVWAGFRRPRGNLVAQSLAAHGGTPLAATLKGRRITRIAVHPHRQRGRDRPGAHPRGLRGRIISR